MGGGKLRIGEGGACAIYSPETTTIYKLWCEQTSACFNFAKRKPKKNDLR